MSRPPNGARSLIIGLEGADLSVIQALGRARLPNLFAAMERGVFADAAAFHNALCPDS